MSEAVSAAVKVAVETTELQRFERPPCPPDGGVLRVESAGVGASDPQQYRRNVRIPTIMGHENVGTIVELGPLAAERWGVAVGDRVALEEYLPCRHCAFCLRGDFRLCLTADFFTNVDPLRYGTSTCAIPPHLWGGYAQYLFLAPNAVLHRVPAGMSPSLATLAIPFGNGFQWAVLDGGTQLGSRVLIFGPGEQGLGCAFAARCAGAAHVILVGQGARDAERLACGLAIGADLVLDVAVDDVRARVLAATDGHGVDVVVDTTGDEDGSVVALACDLAAKGATLSLNGLGQSVLIGTMKKKNLTVRTPRGHSYRSIELALDALARTSLPVDRVVSHDFALAEVDAAIRGTRGEGVRGVIHATIDPWR